MKYNNLKSVCSQLFGIKASDSNQVRKEKTLNIFLLVMGILIPLFNVIIFIITGLRGLTDPEIKTLYLNSGIIFIAIIVVFILNRYISSFVASLLFLSFFILVIIISDRPEEIVAGRSLITWAIPVILASILIKPIASLIISLIEILIIIVLAINEHLPVSIPSLFVLFLISIMVWFSAKTLNNTTDYLKRSRKKYERAYQRINFYKDIFSHDIGNILQNLQSSVDLIKLYLNDPDKVNEIDKVLKIYNSQIKKAEKLVSNVKKISQIEEQHIELKLINSLEVLNNSIKHIKSVFKSRKIEFKIIPNNQNGKFVKANDLLFDVFDNILRNAIIYNNSSIIKIKIRFSENIENQTKYIKIEFMDNGMGIPDIRKKIIFKRGDVKIEKTRGIGVGLPFCKMIIDLFKGKIWVEDRIEGKPEKGTNFVVMIPQ